jgi:hypothetical protein
MKVLHLAVERDLPALFSLVDSMDQDLELTLRLLDQALHDVLIVCVDPKRVINVDLVADLTTIGKRASVKVWSQLARKVKTLQSQYRTTRLHLSFQIKTILIESFS